MMEPAGSDPDRPGELVRIEGVAHGGLGVGRLASGKVVFVRGALPGDRVEVETLRGRRRHAEARLRRLVEASPDRVEARCGHQAVCGGCPLQTLDYPAQLRAKESMAVEAWRRIGGGLPPRVDPILPAPSLFHYRNKMEFGFSDLPWLSDRAAEAEGEFGLGQHVPGIHSKVFNLTECHLQTEWTAPLLATIRRFVADQGGGREAVWHWRGHTGYWRFVVIRESRRTGERMVNLVTSRAGDERAARLAADLLERHPGLISTIVNTVQEGQGQVATGRLDRVLHGDGLLRERLGGLLFELEPPAFFQTNTEQAERLFALAADHLGEAPGELLDLYCGTGAIALLLAGRARHVTGVELVPEAVASARRAAALNGLSDRVDFHAGDVLELLRQGRLPRPDTVVVDPPRGGLHPKVVPPLLELAPRRIVYVSCNPATQARDAALLAAGGYNATRLSPVDMFPHTFHVETVASFERDV
ncbi:MAG: 23S rRNA (uracil(1939)-C(5))-methyltransferase RlmD [bacterium]|nr:23S rRNA (uracil(1939)-C(5))-methyltransferase RlmD [bacterium]